MFGLVEMFSKAFGIGRQNQNINPEVVHLN